MAKVGQTAADTSRHSRTGATVSDLSR
jgi:hypothetical protein